VGGGERDTYLLTGGRPRSLREKVNVVFYKKKITWEELIMGGGGCQKYLSLWWRRY